MFDKSWLLNARVQFFHIFGGTCDTCKECIALHVTIAVKKRQDLKTMKPVLNLLTPYKNTDPLNMK